MNLHSENIHREKVSASEWNTWERLDNMPVCEIHRRYICALLQQKVWMHRHWRKTRDTRYRDKRSSHQGMWSAQHRRFPTSDIREKKKCYSRGYAIARCQAKTTLKSYWHELRDHQEYRKKMAMKTGTHTQVPVPMTNGQIWSRQAL